MLQCFQDTAKDSIDIFVGQRAVGSAKLQGEGDGFFPFRHAGTAVNIKQRDPAEKLTGGFADAILQPGHRACLTADQRQIAADRREPGQRGV